MRHTIVPSLLSRSLMILMLAALLVTLLPQAASAAPLQAGCGKSMQPYIVQRGDSLASIARKFGLLNPFQIVKDNDWSRPYTIYVGQKICVPIKSRTGLQKLSATFANAQAAYFIARWTGKGFEVSLVNYPSGNFVWVKADDAGDKSRNFFKLGLVNTSKKVRAFGFKLPQELQKARSLNVCLKNLDTDYNQCVLLPPK